MLLAGPLSGGTRITKLTNRCLRNANTATMDRIMSDGDAIIRKNTLNVARGGTGNDSGARITVVSVGNSKFPSVVTNNAVRCAGSRNKLDKRVCGNVKTGGSSGTSRT